MKSKNMDNRENFSALSTLSPGSNGVRSFSSPGGINGKRKYDEACFLISCGEKTVLQSHHIRNGFKFVILTQVNKVSKYKQYKTYVLILFKEM